MVDRHVRSAKVVVLVAGVKVAPDLEGVVVKVAVFPEVWTFRGLRSECLMGTSAHLDC